MSRDPNLNCIRCKRRAVEVGNPFGSAVVTIDPTSPMHSHVKFSVCDECMAGMFEYLKPEMAANPAYQAEKDQYRALVRDFRAGHYGDPNALIQRVLDVFRDDER